MHVLSKGLCCLNPPAEMAIQASAVVTVGSISLQDYPPGPTLESRKAPEGVYCVATGMLTGS